ncbi:MAG TPA: aminopeptidase P family N-terminal domain-containing protein [Candidatus Acidoferrales bacterium]|nr:aminopeptidase P family N-terminal domain-containing protein [Candidatus Acidoferrales bacterium]
MRLKPVALLTGPYDWDLKFLPLYEFESRLQNVRRVLVENSASALIVHGNSSEYGALAYLTNFVPKLGPAFALISQTGPVRLLVSGASTMLSAAKRLTWVEDVRPIGDLKTSIGAWLAEVCAEDRSAIGLWGHSKLALRPYSAIKAAIEPRGTILDVSVPLEALRLHKSALEVELSRKSCGILQEAVSALTRAFRSGSGARSAALTAEYAAYQSGAQDARVFVSAQPGGPPLFIDYADDRNIDPLLACVAVRFAGYWSEGFVTLSDSPSAALTHAQEGLAATLKSVRDGATFSDLAAIAAKQIQPYAPHPLVQNSIGNSIDLSIEEPSETPSAPMSILSGGIYTLRCGVASQAVNTSADDAIVSAMINVSDEHTEILWSALYNPDGMPQ